MKKFRACKIQHFADGREKKKNPTRRCSIPQRLPLQGVRYSHPHQSPRPFCLTLLYWGGGGGGMREGKGGILIFQIQMIPP